MVTNPIETEAPEGAEKSFELLDHKSGEVLAVFKNKTPRPAAIKAAGEGHAKIILRERGAQEGKNYAARLHMFEGTITKATWPLPYPNWLKKSVEKKAGKSIPDSLNAKGKESDLAKAGFKPYEYNKGNVKKIGTVKVPKIQGKTPKECVSEYLKNGGK